MWSDRLLNPNISLTQKTTGELWFCSVPAAVQSVPPRVPHQTSGNYLPWRTALQQGLQETALFCGVQGVTYTVVISPITHHVLAALGCAARLWVCSVCHDCIC